MKNVHFIGICGAGMAGIAAMLKKEGYIVSGSDDGFYDPVASYLSTRGFNIVPGYRKENIPEAVDTIVIGKHAKLVPESNEEVAHAFELQKQGKVQIFSFPQVLEMVTKDHTRIVVCGSYGKSTVTAIIAWCLQSAGKNPGYFVGAQVYGLDDPCVLGKDIFVFEGDEYPSANWDSASKFEYYHPHHVLLTSGEHDHVNVFPTHESYLAPFQRLVASVPDSGSVIGCIENTAVDTLIKSASSFDTYGLTKGMWHAENIVWGERSTADIYHDGVHIVSIETGLLGTHNMQNIAGAAALLIGKGFLTPSEFASGIATFKGVKRRLDRIDQSGNVPVYEGFGSSYAKARSAIDAINLHYPNRDIFCVFEPHTFSWRDPASAFWYKDAFRGVDGVLVIMPPLSHGKGADGQLTSADILSSVGTVHSFLGEAKTKEEALLSIDHYMGTHHGAVILILSSGEALGLGPALVAWSKEYHESLT